MLEETSKKTKRKKVNKHLFTFAYQTAEGLATKAMAAAACG